MTQAAEIMHVASNADNAMDRAEAIAVETEQDWDHEATLYIMPDGSVLVVVGPQVWVCASLDDAHAGLANS